MDELYTGQWEYLKQAIGWQVSKLGLTVGVGLALRERAELIRRKD